MGRKIFLVYPDEKTHLTRLPLSLLAIGSVLVKNGFEVKIIDLRFQDYTKFDYSDSVFVGVSTLTGKQLKYALKFSEYIKRKYPQIPVVWGGIHVTLLPTQSVLNKNVDIVVRGEGEITAIELAKALVKKTSLSKIKGLTYKDKKGQVISNSDRPFMNLNDLPPMAYELYDSNKSKTTLGHFPYNSSRGCPHRCKFCYNTAFNKRRWRARDADKVLADIKRIINLTNTKGLEFTEDEFFVDKSRVEKISKGLIDENIKIDWTTSCRFDYFAKYGLDFIKLVKNSGCSTLSFGGESGSKKVLEMITKDITIDDMLKTVAKCKQTGIVPVISFMCGFPYETKQDILQTLNTIDKIHKINPKAHINGLFGFTPYPGTPLFEESLKLNSKLPQNLEEWSEYNFSTLASQIWLDKRYKSWLETASAIVRYNYFNQTKMAYQNLPSKFLYLPYFIFNNLYRVSALLRWRFRFFSFGYEWKFWSFLKEAYSGHY
ncbi:MAG: radical SAM protein [archaeon]